MGLIAILDEEKIKASAYKDLLLEAFKAKGLDKYTWEGIRYTCSFFLFCSLLLLCSTLFCSSILQLIQHLASYSPPQPDHTYVLRSFKMPLWDDKKHVDLLVALYSGIQGEITKEIQDRVVAVMREKGHDDVHWDKIR